MIHISENPMTLWTIQHEEAYQVLAKTGVLHANEQHLMFEEEYEWMAEQMKQKLGNPPKGVHYPMWAWYQWEGKRKRRDLRCGGYEKRGTPMVQITFEIEPEKVLLSDFDEWGRILNYGYLSVDEQDDGRFDAEVKVSGYQHCDLSELSIQEHTMLQLREKVIQSWQRVFDLQRHTPGWDYAPEEKSIQATFWELRMEQVRKVEHFLAK